MMPVLGTCSAATARTWGSCSRASAAESQVTVRPFARPRSYRRRSPGSWVSLVATTSFPQVSWATPSSSAKRTMDLAPAWHIRAFFEPGT